MIVADRKSLEEILSMVKDYNNILILGCKGCVTVCNVGGVKEVEILASALRIARPNAISLGFVHLFVSTANSSFTLLTRIVGEIPALCNNFNRAGEAEAKTIGGSI